VVKESGPFCGVWGFQTQSRFSCSVHVMTYSLRNVICLSVKSWKATFAPAVVEIWKLDSNALWRCPTAQDVWEGRSVIVQKCAFMGDSFMQLMEYCMDRLSIEDMGIMVVLSRKIWLMRNKFIFENIFAQPHVVFNEAVESLEEYRRYNRREEEQVNLGGGAEFH
jgi:hypothetical protein